MEKIKLEGVTKVFGNHPKKSFAKYKQGMTRDEFKEKTGHTLGLLDASFSIHEGEKLVVMGLSGSGKSTLLRCINRLFEPTAGKVIIDGIDVTALEAEELRLLRQKKFGMVFQRFALLPHRTVLKNTEFGLEVQNIDAAVREEKAREALELVGLKGWEDSYPNQLSGGMQQRVGLARALAVDPDILLMDEAFSALDPLIRTEMQDELLSLESKVNKTILFITHDLDEALKIGDRIVMMKDGRIVQIGTPEEILMSPATEYVERFVENVDMTKVLTAKDVMVKPVSISYPKDGPRTALHRMKERGISSIFVVDNERKLKGIVLAENAKECVEGSAKDFDSVIEKIDVMKVQPDAPLQDILPKIADIRYPIAVVDDGEKLLGVIVRGSVIAGLAERGSIQ